MLLFTDQLYGPFYQIVEHPDRYECTGLVLFKTVVGAGLIIDPPLPAEFRADCYTWDGEKLVKVKDPDPQPEPVPTSISMAQARQQLIRLGAYETVNNAISSMSLEAQVDCEYRTSVDRSFPLVAQMQQLLGWTDAEMDTYFTEAAKL